MRVYDPPVSLWDDDAFDGHPVWSQVDTLARLLSDKNLPNELDATQRLSVVRLKTALELLREHQQKALKEFYTKSMLDNADGHLTTSVNPTLSTFVGEPETYGSHVNDAAAYVEQIFIYVGQWPALPAGGQASAAGRAFSEYKKEAETALENLRETNQGLTAEIEALKAQLTTVGTQIQTLEQRYTISLETREGQYVEAITNVQAAGQEAYDKAIAEDLEERGKTLDRLEKRAQKHADGAKAAQANAEEFEKSSKTSAEFLAKKAIATDFGRQARRKTLAGVAYEAVGIAIGGGTIIMLLRHYLSASAATSDNVLAVGLARFSVTVGLFVLAGYLLSRGASNHRQARASKSADIRLQTLEAFISKLDAAKQDEIRNGMAQNIFLHGRLADDDGESTWRLPAVLRGRPGSKKTDNGEGVAAPAT